MTDLGPPFLPVSGLPNFRDLGGRPHPIPSRPGYTIKSGLVFRSAEPSRLTEDGVSALQDLKISHVYDLRSRTEIERYATGTREWPGAQRVFTPVFLDKDYGPEAIALRFQNYTAEGSQGFVKAYQDIWETGTGSINTILSHLAKPDPSPLLIHCTAGKDRTGVICAFILSICGVDDQTIAREYSLTEVGLGDFGEELLAAVMKSPELEANPEGARRLLGAKPENMLAALKALREQHDSVEKYVVKSCGLSEDDLEQIRKNLIVPDTSSQ
ncbi:protein-tyrosine phosphatase-like protein [Fusarium tricinctum]|uniref:Protein-tyrosine phosphatase-like protein n=2 Tax=Fusarium tricinctum species complex TaxID=679429 RepID=A0A8K0RPX1_9HYPO|nr:protein-tyrosine phosphatase-like protein [Fusarium tricinctum]